MIPNLTITVNYDNQNFACRKRCSYCNWITSPYLPNDTYDWGAMDNAIASCSKSFITISGGGDPLYQIDKNANNLNTLNKICKLIKRHGKKVRIITRELKLLNYLDPNLVDIISVSLDREVVKLAKIVAEKFKFPYTFEYSLVLPPAETEHLIPLVHTYYKQAIPYFKNIIFREDVNTFYDVTWAQMPKLPGVKYVYKELCLGSHYFINDKVYDGYTLTPPKANEVNKVLAHLDRNAIVYGSLIKHLHAATTTPYYNDIDIVGITIPKYLVNNYDLYFYKEYTDRKIYVFHHKVFKQDITFHFIEVKDPKHYLSQFQLDIDRVGLKENKLVFCNTDLNLQTYIVALENKEANLLVKRNSAIEAQYFKKLNSKKWKIKA